MSPGVPVSNPGLPLTRVRLLEKDNSFVLLKGVSNGTQVHPPLIWAVSRCTKCLESVYSVRRSNAINAAIFKRRHKPTGCSETSLQTQNAQHNLLLLIFFGSMFLTSVR